MSSSFSRPNVIKNVEFVIIKSCVFIINFIKADIRLFSLYIQLINLNAYFLINIQFKKIVQDPVFRIMF